MKPVTAQPAALLGKVKTLLAVFAHPDDESFICGGLLKLLHDRGVPTVLLTLTKGEASREREQLGLTIPQMQRLRAQELKKASTILGVGTLELHSLPDKALTEEQALPLVAAAFEHHRPTDVLTFAPHGISGHEDHRAVSVATTTLFERLPWVQRLWYATIPLSRLPQNSEHSYFEGDPDDRVVLLDIRAVAEVKRQAILSHQSQQFTLERMRQTVLDDFLTEECYIIHERSSK